MSHFTVLGGGGFIGAALVRHLRDAGHEVDAPQRDDPGLIMRDLGHVVYCIGLTADFRSRPFDTVRAHVSVLTEVLAQGRFSSLLYLSSTRIYGKGGTGKEVADVPVNSADPSDLYNLSKLMGESLCLNGGRQDVRVARLSNVVGMDHGSSNFLFDLIRDAKQGRILLRSALESAKDYILLEDVLEMLEAISLRGQGATIYNVASGHQLSHRQLCDQLAALTGCSVAVADGAPLLAFPEICTARIREQFGFRPRDVLAALPHLVDESDHRTN